MSCLGKICDRWVGKVEFRVETSDNSNTVCVDCHMHIRKGSQRIRIFKRRTEYSSPDFKADCFYHDDCFVRVHKEEFKKMSVDILMKALME